MTMTLAHPPAEDLGRFIEGTLDDAGRAAIIEHIADCDECRIIVVDTTAFGDESAAKPRVTSGRWLAIAASIVLVLGVGAFVWNARRDPLPPVIEAYAGVPSRLIESRLSGSQYVRLHSMRGGEQETDPATLRLQSEIGKVLELQGNNAKALHALGVARLLSASLEKVDPRASEEERRNYAEGIEMERAKAVQDLRAAATAAPDNARYQSDLAAALIATGGAGNLNLAVAACNQAIKIDPRSPEALFNQAKAFQLLGRNPEAIAAYQRYLALDSSSGWADEAKQQIDFLK
jgi:tetratricopeptide (TPR) repeat protein